MAGGGASSLAMKKMAATGRSSSLKDPLRFLPRSIVIQIFECLTPEQVASGCNLVSKAWAEAANDTCLWQKFCRGSALTEEDANACEDGWKGLYHSIFKINLVKCPRFEDLTHEDKPPRVWRLHGHITVDSCPECPGVSGEATGVPIADPQGSMHQIVDLRQLPFTFLDACPVISFSAWYGGRTCDGMFEVRLDLYDDVGTVIQRRRSGLMAVRYAWKHALYLIQDYPVGLRTLKLTLYGFYNLNRYVNSSPVRDGRGFSINFGPVQLSFVRPDVMCAHATLPITSPDVAEDEDEEEEDDYVYADEEFVYEDETYGHGVEYYDDESAPWFVGY